MAHDHDHSHGDHSNPDHEVDWFEIERIYKEKSTEERTLIEWFTENVDAYLPSAVASAREGGSSIVNLSIVSFGCGEGIKDQAILAAVASRLSEEQRIRYDAVDPASGQLEKFHSSIQNEDDDQQRFKKVNFNFNAKTFEEFMKIKEEDETSGKIDLMLFIDSLCHFLTTPEDALTHSYNILSNGGIMMVTLWNNEDFWFKIRDIYGKRWDNSRSSDEGNDYLTIQEVLEVVKKHGWKFAMFSPQYTLDVSECLKAQSTDGKNLIECLGCFSNVEKEVHSDSGKLLQFLEDLPCTRDEKRLLEGKHGILVIHKN